ncbi:hypothetical protein NPIL_89991 [Nephila pilipes]|uniref:Uncharacterized protein n=1 Tax=Nephila pilipes TaxID=299642 RepID=A0A8X6N1B7_NEPPI|nr:hypothetical protein NPIL_89991 [Nephila pilipes]
MEEGEGLIFPQRKLDAEERDRKKDEDRDNCEVGNENQYVRNIEHQAPGLFRGDDPDPITESGERKDKFLCNLRYGRESFPVPNKEDAREGPVIYTEGWDYSGNNRLSCPILGNDRMTRGKF